MRYTLALLACLAALPASAQIFIPFQGYHQRREWNPHDRWLREHAWRRHEWHRRHWHPGGGHWDYEGDEE